MQVKNLVQISVGLLLIFLAEPFKLYSQLKTSLPNDKEDHHVRVIAQQIARTVTYTQLTLPTSALV